jgi:hypothetical protein
MKRLAQQELVKHKSYYSKEWKEGDNWSFSKSTKEETSSWGLINTRQVQLKKVVKGNFLKNQTTTPIIHEIIDSSKEIVLMELKMV